MNHPATQLLIVDDDARNRKLLQTLLHAEGYRTASAASGEEALAMVASDPPDLILLDVMMPGMDGYQVARRLKADPQTANLPIIMVTARTDRAARLEGLEAGAADFLSKPVDRAELTLRVRNLLTLKAYGDQLREQGNELERQVAARTAELIHLNRVHAALSAINVLIVRVRDREVLFADACRIAVESGGFRMAMIAMLDPAAPGLRVAASAVADASLQASADSLLAEYAQAVDGDGLLALAVRRRQHAVSTAATGALVVFPLVVAGVVVGVLLLSSRGSGGFKDDELALVAEMTEDIAFAIDHLDKQERIDYLACFDVLTGLANRRLFLDRLGLYLRGAVGKAQRVAVCLVDVERFRSINDSLGRVAGDTLLLQLAQWLAAYFGDSGQVARIAGDQFAAVLPDIASESDAAVRVDRLTQALLQHPFRLDEATIRIAAKLGVALSDDAGSGAEVLLGNAESALKLAKHGGDRYLFQDRSMSATVARRLGLETQLRQALDRGEFVLHYQPKVHLGSGELSGAEALIRWNQHGTGLVGPDQFISILEEAGFIHDVGRWALRTAIDQQLSWRAAGLPAVRIAVNVSALQLRSRGFIAELTELLDGNADAAAGLELEITESLIMENATHSIGCLKAVRAMGVHIAIDDFGTGFSSLSYLSRLPVDCLKIDRSFVTEMTLGPQQLALVSTIIQLAHAMGLAVVAEGVETDEQRRLLHLLGCDQMQGYLFSRPVSCEEFASRFLMRDSIAAEADCGEIPRRVEDPGQAARPHGHAQA